MSFNKFGINLDEGIPLLEESINTLYVDCFEENYQEICNWIKDDIKTPLLLGGQIGSGKSTLLTKIFLEKELRPDMIIDFDKDSINLDESDFFAIVLNNFIKKSIELNIDLSFSELPNEIFGLNKNDWKGVSELLFPNKFSKKAFDDKIDARKKININKNSDFIRDIILKIGEELNNKKNSFFILVSGIDKFDRNKASFFAMKTILQVLLNFKALFEVNATHLFIPDKISPFGNQSKKIFLTSVNDDKISEILEKRMGVYSKSIKKSLDFLIKYSGGNPRQAIRLLTHYRVLQRNRKLNEEEKKRGSIVRSATDLFSYLSKPSIELIKTIKRDKIIKNNLFNEPGDRDTALQALYENWIFITGEFGNSEWKVIVNPLVENIFENESIIPKEPEKVILDELAEKEGTSSYGLSFNVGNRDTKELIYSLNIENPLPLNIIEILEVMNAALLSKDRKDRVIIAYKDIKILNATRAYLFAKANTYEYQRVKHFELSGDKEPIKKIDEILNADTDIISIEFSGNWNKKALEILDKYRDRFINYQMIWWIHSEKINIYLPYWVHLRELFEVFILEEELSKSLSIENIKDDLEFFEELINKNTETSEHLIVKNLRIVLEHLKKQGEK